MAATMQSDNLSGIPGHFQQNYSTLSDLRTIVANVQLLLLFV